MASLVEQILAQSEAGSAMGATLGIDALQSGMLMKQRREEFKADQALQQERLALDRATVAIQQNQSLLATRVNRMRLEQMESLNVAGAELAELELSMMQDPAGFLSTNGIDRAQGIFRKHADLWGTDAGQAFIKRVQTTIQGEIQLKQLKEMTDGLNGMTETQRTVETPFGTRTFELPTTPKVFDLEGGGKAVQTGPNSFRVLEQEGPLSTPGKVLADRQRLVDAGASAETLAQFDAQAAKNGMVLEVGPDGTTRFVQGPGATAGTASQVQRAESLINLQTQIQRGFQLQELISAQDLGVQGVVGEFLDEAVAQGFPGVADSSRVRNRERLRLFFLGVLPLLMAEGGTGRLSDKDIALMSNALTSEKALAESLQSLGPKMEVIRQELVLKGRASVIASGQEIPLMLMLPEEAYRLRKEGRLDNDSFARYLRQTPFVEEARKAFSSP